jgi:hypothetical protein
MAPLGLVSASGGEAIQEDGTHGASGVGIGIRREKDSRWERFFGDKQTFCCADEDFLTGSTGVKTDGRKKKK